MTTQSQQKRHIMVTTALTYANGAIHLGHMMEYVQTDIWARLQRLRGHSCLFIAGNDAHGTPIMLSAQKQNISAETLVEKTQIEHIRDLKQFSIAYDNFHTTHSAENKALAELFYNRLKERGDITSQTISQAFDEQENIFLPDRFIRGDCPRCGAKDQYGDNCEACGATYSPSDLKNPVSVISGKPPIKKESEHYFFTLANHQDMLENWIQAGHLQPEVSNKLKEWFKEDLRPWDISRDAPYFGFEIPDHPGKYFYVWLDAPIGYWASLKNLADKNPGIHFDDYTQKDSKTELYHFIGKDIIYFHALFWPAMLHGANYRTPTAIFAHGYLTINGEKMSKSRGTFITAEKYAQHLDPEYLRYYFAAKLGPQIEDIDLNLSDFALRVNADLVGKYVNLASRCAGFISKKFDGQLADTLPDISLFNEFANAGEEIAMHYESLNYNKAVRHIMALADRANQYIDQQKPWVLAKETGKEESVQAVCTQGLNLFKLLTLYLKPILPNTAEKAEAFLNIEALEWNNLDKPLLNHCINRFKPLMQRITEEALEQLTS